METLIWIAGALAIGFVATLGLHVLVNVWWRLSSPTFKSVVFVVAKYRHIRDVQAQYEELKSADVNFHSGRDVQRIAGSALAVNLVRILDKHEGRLDGDEIISDLYSGLISYKRSTQPVAEDA